MAFVPDDAMARKREIGGSSWDVYEQLCAFADPNTGIVEACYASNSRLVEKTGLKLGTVKNARTKLRKAGWTEERKNCIFLRVGTFLNKLRKQKKSSAAPSFTSDISLSKNKQLSPTNDAPSSSNDPAYIGSRVRSYQPINQPENAVDVESSPHLPTQQQQSPVSDEFLDKLQQEYPDIDVRHVLAKLMLMKDRTREQVTRRLLVAWCDWEWPKEKGELYGRNELRPETSGSRDCAQAGSRASSRRDRDLAELRRQADEVTYDYAPSTFDGEIDESASPPA